MFRRKPNPTGSPAAQQMALAYERRLEAETANHIAAIEAAMRTLPPDWQTRIEQDAAFVMHATAIREAVKQARLAPTRPSTSAPRTLPRYSVSSRFLRELLAFLIGDDKGRERMALITGVITEDGTRVMSSMVHITPKQQSAAYVQADPAATNALLGQLTETDGHPLLAMAHSHIMSGPDTTRPSATDLAHQARQVAIGSDALGCIVNLTGHCRMFSTAHDFDLAVFGNGVEILEDKPRETLLKITMEA